ncbi:AimR family lysis-lysogeny pheromone receptor [Bacillus toyonensis]|uniref:AimR family lysis-lysogeny pheromone receptor n=1 Tax=Bacillus toyonensis TaxID=155322 RepID=UPI003465117E
MNNVYKRFNSILESQNRSWSSIAKATSTSDSSITEWGKKNKQISVFKVAKMAHEIYPNNVKMMEKSCIDNFSIYNRTARINTKKLFAIAYLNANESIMKYLIDVSINHDDYQIRKLSRIMRLFYSRIKKDKSIDQIYLEIDDVRKGITKEDIDIAILCDILTISILGDKGHFNIFEVYKNRAADNLIYIEEKDLQGLYDFWITDIWSYSLQRRNNLKAFRLCNELLWQYEDLNFFPMMQAMLLSRVGESNIFTDYSATIENLSAALQICKERNCEYKQEVILNNMNFVKLHWKKDIHTIDVSTLHQAEMCIYLYEIGEHEEAKKRIIQMESISPLTAMQMAYKGLIFSDKLIVERAIDMFKSNNDFFFVQYAIEVYNKLERVYN